MACPVRLRALPGAQPRRADTAFVTLLGSQIPQCDILAALLTYRGLYYIGPLLLALVVYTIAEVRLRRADTEPAGAPG